MLFVSLDLYLREYVQIRLHRSRRKENIATHCPHENIPEALEKKRIHDSGRTHSLIVDQRSARQDLSTSGIKGTSSEGDR